MSPNRPSLTDASNATALRASFVAAKSGMIGIMIRYLRTFIFAYLLLVPLIATAQDVWRSRDGKAVPETPARKAVNGFGVWLIITADPYGQEKWNTSVHETPYFKEAKNVSTGGKLAILTFVVNPRPDSNNALNVVSHIEVTRPNGTTSVNSPGLSCVRGNMIGEATNVRLCEAVIRFSADPGDSKGVWKVKVTVRDENRATEIPVESTFNLETK